MQATLHTARLAMMKAVRPRKNFQQVNVDTTVQEKAIAFPTDLAAACITRCGWPWSGGPNRLGLVLRQSYRFQGKRMLAQQGRYAHARQMKRAAKITRQLQTILGRVVRDIERKAHKLQGQIADEPATGADRLGRAIARSNGRTSKHKVYSVHAPEVECIAKGKVHKRYEFGCKTSVATTSKNNWIVGVEALHGNRLPDGHIRSSGAIGQVERLTGQTPHDVMVDQGYRGHGYGGSAIVHVVRTIPKRATRALKRMLRRRAAIEPTIGHLKSDNRMNRNYPDRKPSRRQNQRGVERAGYNLRKLLRWLVFAPDLLAPCAGSTPC